MELTQQLRDGCSFRRPRFGSQYSHDNLQPPQTSVHVPWYPMLSSGLPLQTLSANAVLTYMQAKILIHIK